MHPIEIDALLKLAKTHLRTGQTAEAEAIYHRILKIQPRGPEALHFLRLAAMHRGKLDQALDLVCKSIELEEFKPDYHNNLATVLGRMNRGPQAWSNKGVALEKLGRTDEAIDAYRRAAELRTDYAEALSNLGNALSRIGQHDEAITRLRPL